MAKTTRLLKSFYRLLLPVVVIVVLAGVTGSIWLVHEASQPENAAYLVTPEKYGLLSSRGAQITEETWNNKDGSSARGWLLRGGENTPAVILLHKFGADRSHVLNMGVKLNEATNFTILMPDQRGHGRNPAVKYSSFGSLEKDDALAAVEYLRGLTGPTQLPLVSNTFGIYGLELGAAAALNAASQDQAVKALVLDSVPADPNAVLAAAVGRRHPFASSFTSQFAELGTTLYFYNSSYTAEPVCTAARTVGNRKVMLLAGVDAPAFQASTQKLSKCFPAAMQVQTKLDLSPSGLGIMSASIEQTEAYDQRVVDFFRNSLGNQ